MIRLGITRSESMRWPSTASSAGTSVIAPTTDTAGISIPPIPIERMNGSGRITAQQADRDRRARDDDRAAAWIIVSTIAVSTSRWCWSSSRKRKIISSE